MAEADIRGKTYSAEFYESQRDGSAISATRMVPFLYDIMRPKSVLDVGCGVGHWPRIFGECGASVSHGIDGPWAAGAKSQLASSAFIEFDFATAPIPFRPAGALERYDLITSFEFVEHVDISLAEPLVEFFTSRSDVLIIGGAIPGQGGSHHVNEQWPGYWAALLERRGYVPCDFIRPQFWRDDNILPWYKQNPIAYFKNSIPGEVVSVAEQIWFDAMRSPLPLVHPGQFEGKCGLARPTIKNVASMCNRIARDLVKAAIGRG